MLLSHLATYNAICAAVLSSKELAKEFRTQKMNIRTYIMLSSFCNTLSYIITKQLFTF